MGKKAKEPKKAASSSKHNENLKINDLNKFLRDHSVQILLSGAIESRRHKG
jgi:hypothetical protein